MALASQRDTPGTQREYETIYIVRPDASSEQIHELNARVRGVIETEQGKLLRVENWGKRKLAYEIRKNPKGIYLYWRYLAPPQLVHEIERNLRMIDHVLRFLTVKVDEDIDPGARPTDLTEETFAAAAETKPDEEDLYLAMGRGDDDDDDRDRSDDDDDDDDDDRPRRRRDADDDDDDDRRPASKDRDADDDSEKED